MRKRIQSVYRQQQLRKRKTQKKERKRPVQPIPPKESDKTDIQQTSTKEQILLKSFNN